MTPDVRSTACHLMSSTAVILCGGRGERLRPLTDHTPKPLLPVNGRPMLDYLLEHLLNSGIGQFLLCVGYKAALFEEFATGSAPGVERIRCIDSGEASITKRLLDARPFIDDRALVCYGDTLADVDVRNLMEAHHARKVLATITVHPYRSSFGLVSFDDAGFVCGFDEKPRLPYWVNIGFLLLEAAALERLEPERPLPDFLAALAAERQLGVYPHLGRHWTANTETELRELAADMAHLQLEQRIS